MTLIENRNAALDNVKLILIFAVVLGHIIEPFITDHSSLNALYEWLYSFHMPAFILISGMLSRGDLTPQYFKKIASSILVPFVIFNFLYEVVHYLLSGETSAYLLQIKPYWIMWYLWSLLIWRCTLPIIKKIPFYLPLSLIPALLIGLVVNSHELFGLSRTLYFWPFFLLGYTLTPTFLNSEQFHKVPKFLCGLFLIFIFLFLGNSTHINGSVFYGSFSYTNLGYSSINGIIARTYIIFLSLLTSFAVIRLTPNTLPVPNHLKKNSLYIYIWHGFFIKIAIALGLTSTMMKWSDLGLSLFLIFIALVMTYILSMRIVAKMTNNLIFTPIRKLIGVF